MSNGHVWIVGAGPGDPGLITEAGAAALAQADVVLYDALASPTLLRRSRTGAEVIYVGKRPGHHALTQTQIEQLIVDKAVPGKRVVRLKGGDPFVFGRGGEEALACRKAGVPFTVIPGISSAIAAPAYAGIPVTHRGIASNFLVVTGNDAGGEGGAAIDWEGAARADTLLILMGVATLESNMKRLQAAGKAASTPAACVRWGTRPDQQVVRGMVGTIAAAVAEAGLESPVVTVVGPVAALSQELGWYFPGPLAGRRVVVTRARAQASGLADRLESLGAYVVEAPVINGVARRGDEDLHRALSERWDWIVFASANGVDAVLDSLAELGMDARALAGTQIAAIGGATQDALRARGLIADFVPPRATSESLAEAIPLATDERILLPDSSLTGDTLADQLRTRGAAPVRVTAYDTVLEPLDDERCREVVDADVITFTSASTAHNLRKALGATALSTETKLVSIGRRTSDAVREEFGRLDAEAASSDLDALVDAVVELTPWG
jgi:uroporphyrinogen III methyltransferase/synthase